MTGTNAICKKINAGSRGNNQRLLRVCCSLTETWSANAEKCSVAVLWSSCLHITVKPSRLSAVYLSQSFQTYQSCTHFYCLCWCLHYEDWSDYSVMGPEVSILSTFSWIIKMKVKNPGRIQTNYFKLVLAFVLFMYLFCLTKVLGLLTPQLWSKRHYSISSNLQIRTSFKASYLCVSPFYAHCKCSIYLLLLLLFLV